MIDIVYVCLSVFQVFFSPLSVFQKDKKKRSKSESHEENGPSLLLAAGTREAEEETVVNNTEEIPTENSVHHNDTEKVS